MPPARRAKGRGRREAKHSRKRMNLDIKQWIRSSNLAGSLEHGKVGVREERDGEFRPVKRNECNPPPISLTHARGEL